MTSKYKRVLKSALATLGVEVNRIQNNNELPKYFRDSNEALLYLQGGKSAAFSCPIEQCTHYTALGFGSLDWHPFVETLKQYRQDKNISYSNTKLKDFFQVWQPSTASEAIAGFGLTPGKFTKYAPHYMFLSPWSSLSPNEVDIDIRWWNQKDNSEHGRSDLRYPDHGWAFFGPVHPDKGALEFQRLVSLYESIKEHGYDRSQGFIGVTQVMRGAKSIFLVGGGGYHRAAVMRSLNYSSIPAFYHRTSIVNVDDAPNWPQVRNGLWSEKKARLYVDHLFEFNSIEWARQLNLHQ